MKETISWKARWIIKKYRNSDLTTPYDISIIDGNLLLNEGIGEMWDLMCGLGTPTAFDNTNSRIGVGDSATAESAGQVGLLGTSKSYQAMEVGFPQRLNQTVSFKSIFGPSEGNHDWEEFSIDNGASADKNINRKVISKGTKTDTDTWTITLEITLA